MEFTPSGRNSLSNQPATSGSGPAHQQRPKHRLSLGVKFMRIELFTVIVGVALLLVAVALYAGLADPTSEAKYINKKEYQAVFLNNGQVYFGKVNDLNSKFLVLTNIFYIENNSANSPNTTQQNTNYTLRKLGTTELHAPKDTMIINRDTVTFWENLKDSSQVVTKINEYYKNPDASTIIPTDGTNQPTTTTPQSGPSTTPTPSTSQ
ncbi:hypothetical protein HYW36_02540 [Candidatus Saccharibacteria bacterium]|nr:hypothetical protein [Candidatus Saccharibacteria bacterium]